MKQELFWILNSLQSAFDVLITYEVYEDFIGMMHVPSTTSSSLTAANKNVLVHCILQLSNCRGQAYHGVADMMGHLRGVATTLH